MTAWATPDVIPYPYIEDVRDNGGIPADKFLTIIATSSDLNITSIALKAINADSEKEVILATSGLLHSRFSDGCYEYKQDFVLNGDLKTSGGKWLFEVTSTYKLIREDSEVKSSIRKLPNEYEKAHWYPYYTIVNGTSETIPPSPSEEQPALPPEKPSVSPSEEQPVLPPEKPSISPSEEQPVLPPEKPSVSPPEDQPVLPPEKPSVSSPEDQPVLPPEKPSVSPPEDQPVLPPGKPSVSLPEDQPVLPPEKPSVSPPEDQPVLPECHTTDSTDVSESAWYYDAVKFVGENNLMNGIGNNLFAPDANLSRAQLAQILYNKEGKPTVGSISPFTDVDARAWYSDAVIWATGRNIVGGYGNGLFGPDDNITREQLAVMLWRYAGKPTASTYLTFRDTNQISTFAQSAIYWAVENKILNGKGNNILDPKGFATRAEVAQMLKNYLE